MGNPARSGPVKIAILIANHGDAELFLPVIGELTDRGAVVTVGVADQGESGPLDSAGIAYHTDNEYLEPFILGPDRKCFLWRAPEPGTGSFAQAVAAMVGKYGVPILDVVPGQGEIAALALEHAGNSAQAVTLPARQPSLAADGRPIFPDIGYERYVRLMGIAQQVNSGMNGPFTLLDVGGEDATFQRFVPQATYTAFDGLIGDSRGTGLPAASFDVVVAADVLEHVPVPDRPAFLQELVRVADRKVVLSFPCALANVHEQFLLRIIPHNRWLQEHQAHGLPDTAEVESILQSMHVEFTRHANHSFNSWAYSVIFDNMDIGDELRRSINGFLQKQNYPFENLEPAYRYIYTITK